MYLEYRDRYRLWCRFCFTDGLHMEGRENSFEETEKHIESISFRMKSRRRGIA